MGRKDPLLLFGSVLPDIATTSREELSREEIHYAPRKFYDFVIANYPQLKDLAIGVRLHSNVDRGADYYSDDGEVGYAVNNGKKISVEVAGLLGIEDGQASLVLAHNFIEAAVDLNLREINSTVLDDYQNCLEVAGNEELVDCLASYFKKDKVLISAELLNFKRILSPQLFVSAKLLVENISTPMISMRFGKEVNACTALSLIEKAKQLTKGTFQEYLDEVIEKMRIDFADIISQ
jgi:hypothetical protein